MHIRRRRISAAIASGILIFSVIPGSIFSVGSLAAHQQPEHDPEFSHELALETFDFAWELIRESHFDENLNGVDWHAVREELRPKAAAAASNADLRAVLSDMVSRLGQSHFAILPKESVDVLDKPELVDTTPAERDAADSEDALHDDSANTSSHHPVHENDANKGHSTSASTSADKVEEESSEGSLQIVQTTVISAEDAVDPSPSTGGREDANGGLGMDVRLINGQAVVTHVEPNGAAQAGGVLPGWILASVDGTSVSTLINRVTRHVDEREMRLSIWQMINGLLRGPVDSTVQVIFLDANDNEVEVNLLRRKRPGQQIKFGNLPPLQTDLEAEWVEAESIDVRAGLIRFSIWMGPVARPFAKAVETFAEADGIIIDLRGNLGGVGGMVMGIGGHFFNERVSLGKMISRGQELNFNANPRIVSYSGKRVVPYAGPVVLLVDGMSASTSEVFAAGMQGVGRVHVIGETTAGAALPAAMERMPNGDVLLHAIADYHDPTGVSIEGRGVIPDEEVPTTREELLAGRDRPLEAALRWIMENRDREWKYDPPMEDQ